MVICKGKNKDGTDCGNPVMEGQDYCWRHRDQAPDAGQGGEVRWTRERLEEAIEKHGGPEGLDVAGVAPSVLDLCYLDLHGIVLYQSGEDRKPCYRRPFQRMVH
jgi:hypothetical protein